MGGMGSLEFILSPLSFHRITRFQSAGIEVEDIVQAAFMDY